MLANSRIHCCRVLALALLALLGGCKTGPDMVPVTGTVLLDDKPVEGAAVMFSPAEGRPAEGVTDAQGKFTLTTVEPGDGALVGMHQVTVTGLRTTGIQQTADGLSDIVDPSKVKQEWFVPKRYARRDTSGIEIEVKHGMEPVELKLTSK